MSSVSGRGNKGTGARKKSAKENNKRSKRARTLSFNTSLWWRKHKGLFQERDCKHSGKRSEKQRGVVLGMGYLRTRGNFI